MLPFRRDYNAKRLNRVVNDPAVLPDVAMPGQEKLDLAPLLLDLRNIALMTDEGGILAHWQEPGVYEIHTQFTEAYRGHNAVRTVREMISWLFLRTPAMELQSKVPESNKGALGLVRAINGQLEFVRDKAWETAAGPVDVSYYYLRYSDWLYAPWNTAQMIARGDWFHQKLDAAKLAFLQPPEAHPADVAHDINVGATIEMIFAGQVSKSLTLYNRWARFAGYAEVNLVNADPLVIDIQDAILLVDLEKKDFEVLQCKTRA